MNDRGDRELVRAARAVSDRKPVDWEAVGRTHPRLQPLLENLRLVEAVGYVHRGAGTTVSGAAAGPAPAGGEDHATTASGPFPESWGALRLLERIGEGAHGEVFRAYDPSLCREVALKLRRAELPAGPGEIEHFLGEARQLARVRQRNLLVVHGADVHDGRVGFWTDLLDGKTLEAMLRDMGPLEAQEAALIGMNLCRALAAIHDCGLVHADVKTSNVMRERGGRIVLLDFGAVRQPTRPGDATGTPLYLAPEEFTGEPASPATDLYALGVLLYRLVSGHYPVEAPTLVELAAKHARGERTLLHDVRPDLAPGFVKVVERALAPLPEGRYASAGAMERDLAMALGGITPSEALRSFTGLLRGRRPALGHDAWWREPARLPRWVWVLVGAAAVALAAAIALLLLSR